MHDKAKFRATNSLINYEPMTSLSLRGDTRRMGTDSPGTARQIKTEPKGTCTTNRRC